MSTKQKFMITCPLTLSFFHNMTTMNPSPPVQLPFSNKVRLIMITSQEEWDNEMKGRKRKTEWEAQPVWFSG